MPQSHLKRHSGEVNSVVTAGFTPGGHIPSGYSYLSRSHSLITSSRRNAPTGMGSPKSENFPSVTTPCPIPTSPTSVQHPNHTTQLCDVKMPSPRLAKSQSEAQSISQLVSQLPPNPKVWTPSQVALYLTHVLDLTPRPVVEDVTAYVRQSRFGGKVFLRLKEQDLEAEGLNLKWRKLMIEAVKKLRRDCLRGRIWGFEGGLQLPRQEDELIQVEATEEDDSAKEKVPITAQGTLKRLRDKKAIRQMISGFENPVFIRDANEGPCVIANGHHSRSSVSSLSFLQSDSSTDSPYRRSMTDFHCAGYVKATAENFTSLSDASTKHHRRDFTKAELEHWFGDLSDEEAEALANDLFQDEELSVSAPSGDAANLDLHSSSSSCSNLSSEMVPVTPQATEGQIFSLTPLDTSIIESIVQESQGVKGGKSTDVQAFSDITEDLSEEAGYAMKDSHQAGEGTKFNLYRASTYEFDKSEASSLNEAIDRGTRFNTVRKIDYSPLMVNASLFEENSFVDNTLESIDVTKTPLSSFLPSSDFGEAAPEHMRNMSAHEASGLSPYKPISQPMSRRSSQRRHREEEKGKTMTGTMSKGSGGINSMQLTAMLIASGLAEGSHDQFDTTDDGQKAENESGWGTTVNRKASRRGTFANHEKELGAAAASRMADLFTPTETVKSIVDNEVPCLQLPKIQAEVAGRPVRDHSMVLVERRKFESLNRRMGALEIQLAEMESATAMPSTSDLSSISKEKHIDRLDQIFARLSFSAAKSTDVEGASSASDKVRSAENGWNLGRLLRAVPSYTVGLTAGVTFVLFNELLGKSRR